MLGGATIIGTSVVPPPAPVVPATLLDPFAPAFAAAKANNLARLDKPYSYKGWDIGYPSAGDSLLQDVGGVRTGLDKYGIGVIVVNNPLFAQNALSTPAKVPNTYAPSANRGAVGAGNQVYAGERPTFVNAFGFGVSCDLSHYGIPDAQFDFGFNYYHSTWQPYLPNVFSLGNLSYYQSLFGKKLEIEVGFMTNTERFIGDRVAANFTSTFGPAASINILLGMSFLEAPSANIQANITDRIYDKVGVQRSAPVNGATGNPIFDEATTNPTGARFSVPGEGVFVVNEVGYRNAAAPGDPQTWLRFGGMYNSSRFRDYSQLLSNPAATLKGNEGLYALVDRQIVQTAPGSPLTAYRGIYLGATFEYAPPRETPITQYYEGRIYSIGPFDSRPTDLVSFVYNHQTFSHFVADQLNPVAIQAATFGLAVPMAQTASNAYTLSYLAHLAPGLYVSTGLSYVDHPSATYFLGEGHALDVLFGATTVF